MKTSPYQYQILKDHLLARIRSGEYGCGARIESEPELARRFGLSRNTVRQAVKELESGGYLYSVRGKGTFVRNAAPERSRKIALMIYDTAYMLNPVTANLIRGIDAGLLKQGYILDVLASRRSFHDEMVPRLAEAYAGFLVGAYQMDRLVLRELEESGRPFLFVKNYLPSYEGRALRIDYERAGFLVAEHLAGRGCRDLGLVYPGEDIAISRDFAAGVRRACLEHGVRLSQGRVLLCGYMEPLDPDSLAPLLDDPPDGIVCPTDQAALDLCAELRRRGIPVPGKVKVTGCNHTVPASRTPPPLTTVEIPTYELGLLAAERMAALLQGSPLELPPPVPPELVEGEST